MGIIIPEDEDPVMILYSYISISKWSHLEPIRDVTTVGVQGYLGEMADIKLPGACRL